MSNPAPIPTSRRRLWEEFRLRVAPVIVFTGAVLSLAVLWRGYVGAPMLVGQAEPLLANVNCYKPGMLAQLSVERFQNVRAGEPVGQVLIADPKVLATSLAVIQAEIEMLRTGTEPLTLHQRTAMDYSQLRLDWMRQRTQLAMARVNLQLAEAEYRRTEKLFNEKIVSESVLEIAKAEMERLKSQAQELGWLVDEQSKHFTDLQQSNTVDLVKVSNEPLRAAIAAQESKLRLTEAELSPVVLRAPVDGMVNVVYRRSGEAVAAGEPILTIAAANAVRIVGYLRPPILDEPQVGTRVEVRTRGAGRQAGLARVIEVGTQFEAVAPALQTSLRLTTAELGLPLGISIPPNLRIRPGELVDLIFLPNAN